MHTQPVLAPRARRPLGLKPAACETSWPTPSSGGLLRGTCSCGGPRAGICHILARVCMNHASILYTFRAAAGSAALPFSQARVLTSTSHHLPHVEARAWRTCTATPAEHSRRVRTNSTALIIQRHASGSRGCSGAVFILPYSPAGMVARSLRVAEHSACSDARPHALGRTQVSSLASAAEPGLWGP